MLKDDNLCSGAQINAEALLANPEDVGPQHYKRSTSQSADRQPHYPTQTSYRCHGNQSAQGHLSEAPQHICRHNRAGAPFCLAIPAADFQQLTFV